MDSLHASWKDNVSPTELIGASEDRVLSSTMATLVTTHKELGCTVLSSRSLLW